MYIIFHSRAFYILITATPSYSVVEKDELQYRIGKTILSVEARISKTNFLYLKNKFRLFIFFHSIENNIKYNFFAKYLKQKTKQTLLCIHTNKNKKTSWWLQLISKVPAW